MHELINDIVYYTRLLYSMQKLKHSLTPFDRDKLFKHTKLNYQTYYFTGEKTMWVSLLYSNSNRNRLIDIVVDGNYNPRTGFLNYMSFGNSTDFEYRQDNGSTKIFDLLCTEDELKQQLFQLSTYITSNETLLAIELAWNLVNKNYKLSFCMNNFSESLLNHLSEMRDKLKTIYIENCI